MKGDDLGQRVIYSILTFVLMAFAGLALGLRVPEGLLAKKKLSSVLVAKPARSTPRAQSVDILSAHQAAPAMSTPRFDPRDPEFRSACEAYLMSIKK